MAGICRLCATLQLNLTQIAKPDIIRDKLSICCRINLDADNILPKSICKDCLSNLNASYSFYADVQDAQKKLQTLLPKSQTAPTNSYKWAVKKEPEHHEKENNKIVASTSGCKTEMTPQTSLALSRSRRQIKKSPYSSYNKSPPKIPKEECNKLKSDDLDKNSDGTDIKVINAALDPLEMANEERHQQLDDDEVEHIFAEVEVVLPDENMEDYGGLDDFFLQEDLTVTEEVLEGDSYIMDKFNENDKAIKFTKKRNLEYIGAEYILTQTPQTREMIKRYETTQKLEPVDRKMIVYKITEVYAENNLKFTTAICKQLAMEIIQIFPTEIMDTYFLQPLKSLPPKGKLWDRYSFRYRQMKNLSSNKRQIGDGETSSEVLLKKFKCEEGQAKNVTIGGLPQGIHVREVLMQTVQGSALIATYQKTKNLQPIDRTFVVHKVIGTHVESNLKMTIAMCRKIAEEIIEVFPYEEIGTYFLQINSKKPPKGKLWDRYQGVKRRFRKNYPEISQKGTLGSKTPEKLNMVKCEEMEKICEMLKTEKNIETIALLWEETMDYRAGHLPNSTPLEVLNKWPLYLCETNSKKLIDMDFEHNFPTKNLSYVKWEKFIAVCYKLFNDRIKDRGSKDLLSQFDDLRCRVDADNYNIIVMKLLPAILIPTCKVIDGQRVKHTIEDSRKAFSLEISNKNDMQKILEVSRTEPYIVVYGEEYEFQHFYVVLNESIFEFESFLEAVEHCFKLLKLLNCKYPMQCEQVWTFISEYLFELEDIRRNPVVSTFIKDIDSAKVEDHNLSSKIVATLEKEQKSNKSNEMEKICDALKTEKRNKKIVQMWEETMDYRKENLQSSTTAEILAKWPLYLCETNSQKLVNMDFENYFPKKSFSQVKWDKFISICNTIFANNIKDRESKILLAKLDEMEDADNYHIMAMKILPAILKPGAKVVNGQRVKYTIEDSRREFCVEVSNKNDFQKMLGAQTTRTDPYLVVYGKKFDFKSFYVVLNESIFEFDTFMEAVVHCFKLLKLFNCIYPLKCEKIWMFISEFIFGIDEAIKCPDISTLVKDANDAIGHVD